MHCSPGIRRTASPPKGRARAQTNSTVTKKKAPRNTLRGFLEIPRKKLLLRRLLSWRLRCCGLRSRLRLCWRRSSGLHRIGLVVQTNNVLCHVDLVRFIKKRRVLGRGVQDHSIAAFTRVAVQNVDQFAADSIDNFPLRGVHIFLVFILFTVDLLPEPLPLGGQPGLFFWTKFPCASL